MAMLNSKKKKLGGERALQSCCIPSNCSLIVLLLWCTFLNDFCDWQVPKSTQKNQTEPRSTKRTEFCNLAVTPITVPWLCSSSCSCSSLQCTSLIDFCDLELANGYVNFLVLKYLRKLNIIKGLTQINIIHFRGERTKRLMSRRCHRDFAVLRQTIPSGFIDHMRTSPTNDQVGAHSGPQTFLFVC